jgi:hypothetical protein
MVPPTSYVDKPHPALSSKWSFVPTFSRKYPFFADSSPHIATISHPITLQLTPPTHATRAITPKPLNHPHQPHILPHSTPYPLNHSLIKPSNHHSPTRNFIFEEHAKGRKNKHTYPSPTHTFHTEIRRIIWVSP